MFKLVGIVIGYWLLGFFGAIIGFFVGGAIDRNIAYGSGAINPLGTAKRQAVFIETLFILKGRLAKADGHISPAEIAHTEQVIQQMGLTAAHRKIAIELFKKGSSPEFDIGPQLQRFTAACGNTHNLKQMLLVYLIVLALSDGRIDADEESLLLEIARHLGYDENAFRQLLQMVLGQASFSGAGGGPSAAPSALADAYKALGISKESTDQEVKRAYRKLMSQYHPDKLMGQGLPEDMIAVATKQAQEVQLAYDLITKSRQPQ